MKRLRAEDYKSISFAEIGSRVDFGSLLLYDFSILLYALLAS